MTACDKCGVDGTFLFTCPDCGSRFCEEHRDPTAHGCASTPDVPESKDRDPDDGEPGASNEEPLAESAEDPDASLKAEAPTSATPDDEKPDAGDEAMTAADLTSQAQASEDETSEDETDDAIDPAESRGGLSRIPLLGRFFG